MNKGRWWIIILLLTVGSFIFTATPSESQSKRQMLKDFFYAGTMYGWQMNRPYMYPYYGGYPYWNPWYGWYTSVYPPYAYSPYGYPYACPPGIYPPPWYWSRESPYAGIKVNPAGQLTVLVDPVDTEVRVDGKKIKQMEELSYQVGLLVGTHKVEVRKEGYKPFSTDVEIRAGGGVFLPIQLTKK